MNHYQFPRCRIIPLPDHQVAFEIDGTEMLHWHYGPNYPRPFFYPFMGSAGESLTRMGHPGAANHDHHRSVWFAHHKVLGIDFWSENTEARVQQKNWLAYRDGNDEAIMATLLGWYDGHDPGELLEQEVIAAVRPIGDGARGTNNETLLEIQSTFRPKSDSLEFGKTNFGFFAVRVAKSLSAHFGGGELTNSEGQISEQQIFGKKARWMDYSGPIKPGITEGITYFDHPANPNYPNRWHVREDGWMGASLCMDGPLETKKQSPLTLRFLLHAHSGPINKKRAEEIATDFHNSPGFQVSKATVKHQQYSVGRLKTE